MSVTGKQDLESLSFDWKRRGPGMASTKCCAGGTRIIPDSVRCGEVPEISFACEQNPVNLAQVHGVLRKYYKQF